MSTKKIHIPDIGDLSDVPVVEIAVAVGDIVDEGDQVNEGGVYKIRQKYSSL